MRSLERRERILYVQREKEERAGGPGLIWMSPQSVQIETRRGR